MALDTAAAPQARFCGAVVPYAARADRGLLAALEQEALALGIPHVRGITVSSAGFFAEQGRGVARVRATLPHLLDALEKMDCSRADVKVENMEMEAGILLHFLGGLGYRAAVVCVVVNSRREGTFLTDFRQHVCEAARIALRAFRQCGDGR
ncbi:MAG TPA: hypothetical protein VIU40_03250 [Geobacteraceae bacterium]